MKSAGFFPYKVIIFFLKLMGILHGVNVRCTYYLFLVALIHQHLPLSNILLYLPIEIDFTPPCLETYGYTHTHMFLSSAHMGNILIYLFIHNFIL